MACIVVSLSLLINHLQRSFRISSPTTNLSAKYPVPSSPSVQQGRRKPRAELFFAKVKAIALDKRELQGQRHSFWAVFWKRAISVYYQRDIARPELNIPSSFLRCKICHVRSSYRRHFLDLSPIQSNSLHFLCIVVPCVCSYKVRVFSTVPQAQIQP